MYTREHYIYYQPEYKDGTNSNNSGLPDGLWSFQAFLTPDICKKWLESNGYNPDDFVINEYQDDDIEEVTIIDCDNDGGERILDRIEDLDDDEIADRIEDTVIWNAGSIDNLHTCKQDDETQQEYEDRIYTWALDLIHDAISEIEENNDYNFQSYAGTPETEWYDEARGMVLDTILSYMTEGEPEEDL